MVENIVINTKADKVEKYQALVPQIKSLVEEETNLISKLANISAALKQTFDFFWVGFYLVEEETLRLGPFQGPVACMNIKVGEGVCGIAFKEKRSIIVSDVNEFNEHIACNPHSKSEIVVPIFNNNNPIGVLDIDSDQLDDFSATDLKYLQTIVELI